MNTHSVTHKQLVLDRVGVALAFFCCGSFFGLLALSWVPATLLSSPSKLAGAFLAVVFGLVYPAMRVLTRLSRGKMGSSHDRASH